MIATMRSAALDVARALRGQLRRLGRWTRGVPAPGRVNLGDLRRTSPLCADFGFSRGQAIDRVYIERFLADHAADIRGDALEILDSSYTRRFGQAVSRSDVLDIDPSNRNTTIVADLTCAPDVADAQFDVIIITQTLQLIFDASAALATAYRLLRPGGVLLLTVPGISSIGSRRECHRSWCWSFTDVALQQMLRPLFGDSRVATTTYGNVLAATGFLHGMAAEELSAEELAVVDRDYPVIVAARAVKAGLQT
jgi:SAM-dependent methyltransferase